SLGFEIGVVYELHHFARAPFEQRSADESDPLGRLVVITVVVLVLDTSGLERQQQKIASFPIVTLAIHFGPSLSLDYVDHEAALITVLDRVTFAFLNDTDYKLLVGLLS